jgi:hypothetical protein
MVLDVAKPIHQVAQQENNSGSFKDPENHGAGTQTIKLFHGKTHGIAYSEQKGRKHEVCRRKTKPFGMFQWRKWGGAASRIVYNDHKNDRHSAKNIQRKKPVSALFHSLKISLKFNSGNIPQDINYLNFIINHRNFLKKFMKSGLEIGKKAMVHSPWSIAGIINKFLPSAMVHRQ